MPQTSSNTVYSNNQLESMIDQCQSNSIIYLIKQGLTDADMNIVVNRAIINKQCRKLFLATNRITPIGSSIIATALNNNTTLELLSLAYNQLSDEGVRCLTEVLARDNSKIKTLSLHATGITDKSAKYLADMLKKNTTLTWLHLGRNKISDTGISRLADVLTQYNTTLKALDLSHNELITDSCIESLVKILKDNKSLETLWINNCNLSSKRTKELQQIAPSNQRFFLLFV